MDPTQCLRDEHALILQILSCFERALGRARAAGAVHAADLRPFVDFFRGFADACHHSKEETELFPRLADAGLPLDAGPLHCMLEEHERGRRHLHALEAALDSADGSALRTILDEGCAYIELLRDHIAKEDHVLFEMAASLLQGEDASQLLEAFATVDGDATYRAARARGEAIATALLQTWS